MLLFQLEYVLLGAVEVVRVFELNFLKLWFEHIEHYLCLEKLKTLHGALDLYRMVSEVMTLVCADDWNHRQFARLMDRLSEPYERHWSVGVVMIWALNKGAELTTLHTKARKAIRVLVNDCPSSLLIHRLMFRWIGRETGMID